MVDIQTNIDDFRRNIKPLERDASFDYCFNYFQSFREQQKLKELVSPENLQESCLQLGFYLASWGMYRGGTFLLKKSIRAHVPVIEAIARADAALWEIDVHCYTPSNIQMILGFKNALNQAFRGIGSSSDTLVTKIMLGVFGNVPAFDTNFKKGSSISSFGKPALEKVALFYQENKSIIEKNRIPTLDFSTGQPTHRRYSRAKMIDMIFFIEGSPRP